MNARRHATALGCLLLAAACAHRAPPITKIVHGKVIVTRSVDPNAYEHVARSLLYEEEGRLEDAADEIERALNFDRDAPELHARLAEVLIRLDRLDDAEEAVKESLARGETIDGLVAQTHLLQARGDPARAVAPLRRACELVDFTNEPAEAERTYLELTEAQIMALELDAALTTLGTLADRQPSSTAARVRIAAVAWPLAKLDVAERRLHEALAVEPNQIDAVLTLAWLQTAEGRLREARASFRQALDRSEGALDVGQAFARFLMATGDTGAARELVDDLVGGAGGDDTLADRVELERIVKRHERALELVRAQTVQAKDPELRARLSLVTAEVLEDQGRKDDALAALRAVPGGTTVTAVARLRAATLLREAGRLGEAGKLLAEAAAAAPSDDLKRELVLAHALLAERNGDVAAAVRALDDALADDPDDVRLVIGKAALIERHGRWQDALELVEGVIARNPASSEALNFWGFVAVDHGHAVERGTRRIRAALALEPGSGAIIDSLGWAHLRAGELATAARFLEQAGRLEPDDPEILGHLGELYSRRGETGRAVEALRRALARKPDQPLKARLEEQLRSVEGRKAKKD